jgi:hypothetical protein
MAPSSDLFSSSISIVYNVRFKRGSPGVVENMFPLYFYFFCKISTGFVLFFVYIDDIVITRTDSLLIRHL